MTTKGGKRTGAGRKSLHPGKKAISIMMTQSTWQKVTDKAKELNISRSDLIEGILIKHI